MPVNNDTDALAPPHTASSGGSVGGGKSGMVMNAVGLPATKRVTLMYFDFCAPALGATVVLRGGSNDELKCLKRILAASAYIAADLASEAW